MTHDARPLTEVFLNLTIKYIIHAQTQTNLDKYTFGFKMRRGRLTHPDLVFVMV